MKSTTISAVVLGLGLLSKHVDAKTWQETNTGDLCKAAMAGTSASYHEYTPAQCDANRIPPTITVGGIEYSNNQEHLVVNSPAGEYMATGSTQSGKGKKSKSAHGKRSKGKKGKKGYESYVDPITVYLPGTTDWPALSSCAIQAASSDGQVVIGLSYSYLSSGDKFRNGKCSQHSPSVEEAVKCLTEQHNDAIYGGNYGATHQTSSKVKANGAFWAAVDPRDSIQSRLGLLLAKLHMDHPTEGWDQYFMPAASAASLPTPVWENIAFVGHSQGAGHAAFLAQTKSTAGAGLISGPQDECQAALGSTDYTYGIGCPLNTKFWVDESFQTKYITAFAHTEEPLYASVIKENLRKIAATGTTSLGYPLQTVDSDLPGPPSYFASGGLLPDFCTTTLTTSLNHSDMSPCGGKEHCSTALDDSAPTLETSSGSPVYVFNSIWWQISQVSSCRLFEQEQQRMGAKLTVSDVSAVNTHTAALGVAAIALVAGISMFAIRKHHQRSSSYELISEGEKDAVLA